MRQRDPERLETTQSRSLRALQAIGRALVFIVGAAFGYLMAQGFASFPGGGPRVVVYLRIYGTFALGLAAPICWYFAVRGKAGDRWTLAYLGAWALWFVIAYLSALIF
jgi:hypothetical protein